MQKKVEDEEVSDSYYDYKIEEIEDEVKDLMRDLEQLGLDMKSIEELDASVGKRIEKVDEHISLAMENAKKAYEMSEEMWRFIDHKKAEKRFYDIRVLHEQEKARYIYIDDDLTHDFDNVITSIKNQIERVKNEMQDLEGRGLIIKHRSQRLTKIKEEKRKKELEKELKGKPQERRRRAKRVVEQTWYQTIINMIVDPVVGIITYIGSLFGGVKQISRKTRRRRG